MAITDNVLAGDLPRLVVYIGRDMTRQTGCTMWSLRHGRRLWASRAGLTPWPSLTYEEWLAAAQFLVRRQRLRGPESSRHRLCFARPSYYVAQRVTWPDAPSGKWATEVISQTASG